MIKVETRRRNVAALVYLAAMAVAIYRAAILHSTNNDGLGHLLVAIILISAFATSVFFLRAKSRSAGWLVLAPATVFAWIAYACLDDHSDRAEAGWDSGPRF
jgi:hypothetical protein